MARKAEVELGFREQEMHELREALHSTCWLNYCCCVGQGCTSVTPLISSHVHCCCVEGISGFTECWDDSGCINFLHKCCCLVNVVSFPPGNHDSLPVCACCNLRFGNDKEEEEGHIEIDKYEQILANTFMCFYMGCAGFGCANPCDPMVMSHGKVCCVASECETTTGMACWGVQKFCCCISSTACPPGSAPYDAPNFACLGMKFGGAHHDDDESDLEHGPGQEAMLN